MPQTNLLIKLDGLTMTLAKGERRQHLVRTAELELPPRTAVGIVGESGSGKTLTVSSILGLVPFLPGITAGSLVLGYDQTPDNVWRDGPWLNRRVYDRRKYFTWQRRLTSRMKRYRGKKISIIFQKAKVSLNPFLKIKDQVFESLKIAGESPNIDSALYWLNNCGFNAGEASRIADQYPHQLSGGQAQRAVMAITLSSQSQTVIADEPTTGLDAKLQVETLIFIKQMLDKFERSAIIISHNLYSLAKFTDICYVMYRGLTLEKGPTAKILEHKGTNHPYTQKLQGLVESGDVVGQTQVRTDIAGCPFYANCHIYRKFDAGAQKRCRESEPPKISLDSDHYVRCWAFEK